MKKGNFIFWIVVIIIIFLLNVLTNDSSTKRGIENFNRFDSAVINCKIEFVDIKHQGDHIILSDGRDFVAYLVAGKKPENGNINIFLYTATKGDSIAKKAYVDTLYLFKGNHKFAYVFSLDYRGK